MQGGSPDPGWFGDPSARLKSVLSDDDQRQALTKFLDSVLDDGDVDVDSVVARFSRSSNAPTPSCRSASCSTRRRRPCTSGWPSSSKPTPSPAWRRGRRRIRGPTPPARSKPRCGQCARTRSRVAARSSGWPHPAREHRRARRTPPAAGEFHLGGIGVHVDIPTATSGDDPPSIGLQLKALQLPGGTAKDFDLGLGTADQLEHTVVELVLGLVQAQAATAGGALGTRSPHSSDSPAICRHCPSINC